MKINSTDFWVPYDVLDLSHQSRFKSFLLKIGEKVDQFLYLGKRYHSAMFVRSVEIDSKCLKGKAKVLLSNSIKVDFHSNDEEKEINTKKTKLLTLIFKVSVITLFSLPLFLIKCAYRFFYLIPLKKFVDLDKQLNELIQKYPNDIDLQVLKKHLKFKDNNSFNIDINKIDDLKEDILFLEKVLKKNPNHTHSQALLHEIFETFMRSRIEENFDEIFDFFIDKFSNKIPSFWKNHSLNIKSVKEKECLRFLWNTLFFKSDRENINEKNALVILLSNLNEAIFTTSSKEFIDTVTWLITNNKNCIFFKKPKNSHSPLSLFKYHLKSHKSNDFHSTDLAKLLKKIELMDAGFTQEFLERTLLSNLFGLDAITQINQTEHDLGGLSSFSYKHFLKISDSFDYFTQDKKMFDLKQVLEKIKKQNPADLTKTNDLINILKNKKQNQFHISIISVGDMSHAISQIRYKNLLFLGNRGAGARPYPGILVFKIDEQKFNPKNGKALKLKELFSSQYVKNLLNQKYFKDLNAKYLGYLPLSYQRHKNCPWKAFKMNILSILFVRQAFDQIEKGISFEKIKKQFLPDCLKLQKMITHECRLEAFRNYLEKHKRKSFALGKDENLVQKIQAKAKKKNWALET